VCIENINPHVVVVKSAKDVAWTDDSSSLNGPRDWHILVQRPMRSDVIVIDGIGSQDPAQMRLAQDDKMVQALALDRADQPFGKAILQRRRRRDRLVPNAHGADSACDNGAVDAIPIADQIARRLIPRERLGQLARNPFSHRICCNVDPNQLSSAQTDDDEGIEPIEAYGRNDEQVHGCNVRCVIPQERASAALRGRP
jgi:hypothetical protein